ncbi:MAG: hypothetical protein ABTQ31_02300, partial [Rhizobiaceae bacterium]
QASLATKIAPGERMLRRSNSHRGSFARGSIEKEGPAAWRSLKVQAKVGRHLPHLLMWSLCRETSREWPGTPA